MKKTTPQETLDHLAALIEKHGGMAPLARVLGTNGPVIQMWVARKRIPLPWQMVIKKMKADKKVST